MAWVAYCAVSLFLNQRLLDCCLVQGSGRRKRELILLGIDELSVFVLRDKGFLLHQLALDVGLLDAHSEQWCALLGVEHTPDVIWRGQGLLVAERASFFFDGEVSCFNLHAVNLGVNFRLVHRVGGS